MRNLKHLVIVGLVVLVAVFLAAPGAFAKKKLADAELDLITAAGEPTIVQTTSGSIFFSDSVEATLDLSNDAQSALQGLIVNNISGENQIATALNIVSSSAPGATVQNNTITQSWGATKDWTAVTAAFHTVAGFAPTAVATAAAAAAADAARGGDNEQTNTQNPPNAVCSFGILGSPLKCAAVRQTNTVVGGNAGFGGNAAASSSSSAASSNASQPGVPGTAGADTIAVLTMYADQIIHSQEGDTTVIRQITPTLSLADGAQAGLAALVVNNIAGLNQVATAMNIASGILAFTPLAIANSGGTNTLDQLNTIQQCRGTPCSRP